MNLVSVQPLPLTAKITLQLIKVTERILKPEPTRYHVFRRIPRVNRITFSKISFGNGPRISESILWAGARIRTEQRLHYLTLLLKVSNTLVSVLF